MSHQDAVTRPRHRQHWSQASPVRVISAIAGLWLIVTAALWVGLQPGTGGDRISSPPHQGYAPHAPVAAAPPAPSIPPVSTPDSRAATARPTAAGSVAPSITAPARPRSPSRTRPVADPPAEKPGGPSLALTQSAVPPVVDLSAEGTLDWMHWGLRDPGSRNRKANGTNAIADDGNVGPRERYDTNTRRFTWRAGAPDEAVMNTPTGVYACGVDSGFTISVAAGPRTRVLRFYAGVARATGRLEATLSGTGLSRSATLSTTSVAAHTARFSIAFRAPAGGRLVLRWRATEVFNMYCGNVNMQAATLR